MINNVSTRLVSKDSIIDDDYINDSGTLGMPAKQTYWQAQVKSLLKAKLKRRDLSYVDLAEKLAGIGVRDNQRNISNKIARGTFTAVFFVQCMEAIGVKVIHLDAE